MSAKSIRLRSKSLSWMEGIENRLMLHEGMWHVFQGDDIPEAPAAYRDMATFFEPHWVR